MKLPSIEDITEVLPVADLAQRAGFGRRTLYDWLRNGDVPGKGLAREYRIRAIREALDKARAEQAKPAATKRRRTADDRKAA